MTREPGPESAHSRPSWSRCSASLALALLLSACAPAPSCDQCLRISETFLAQLSQGRTSEAFEYLATTRLKPTHGQEQNRLIDTTNALLKDGGALIGYELIATEVETDRVVTNVYLLYQATGVMRWTFLFYRPDTDWRLAHFGATQQFADYGG